MRVLSPKSFVSEMYDDNSDVLNTMHSQPIIDDDDGDEEEEEEGDKENSGVNTNSNDDKCGNGERYEEEEEEDDEDNNEDQGTMDNCCKGMGVPTDAISEKLRDDEANDDDDDEAVENRDMPTINAFDDAIVSYHQ